MAGVLLLLLLFSINYDLHYVVIPCSSSGSGIELLNKEIKGVYEYRSRDEDEGSKDYRNRNRKTLNGLIQDYH